MNAATLLVSALLLAPAHASADDEEQPVAFVADEGLPRSDYEDWLFDRFGVEALDEYIDVVAVERGARDAGIVVTPEDVAERHDAEVAAKIARFFRDDPARFEQDLARRGFTRETWRRFRERQVRHDLLLERLVRRRREITDEDIAARYEVIYGQDAERTTLEVLFFSHYHGVDPADAATVQRDDLVARSRERAEGVREEMRAGAPLDELRELSDPIRNDFIDEGRIERYRRNLLGPELDEAIDMLDRPGETTPVVTLFDGQVLARLVERETVTLESARDAIERELREAPPTSTEVMELLTELREKYELRRAL